MTSEDAVLAALEEVVTSATEKIEQERDHFSNEGWDYQHGRLSITKAMPRDMSEFLAALISHAGQVHFELSKDPEIPDDAHSRVENVVNLERQLDRSAAISVLAGEGVTVDDARRAVRAMSNVRILLFHNDAHEGELAPVFELLGALVSTGIDAINRAQ